MTDSEKDSDLPPVTREEYDLVRRMKGTPEQIERVRAALQDEQSPLYQSFGEGASWARYNFERRHLTPEQAERLLDRSVSAAQKNTDRLVIYMCDKRKIGVMTDAEVQQVIKTTKVDFLLDPKPSQTIIAMCYTRMVKALIKLRPDLEAEVRALAIERPRGR